MRARRDDTDQLPLDWSRSAEIERIIEVRAALRAEADALRWRFRLVLVESVMMAALVLAGGLALNQPTAMVVRSAMAVGAASLASGLMLVGLSGVTVRLMTRYRRWRRP
jgi:hypothetical protein